MSMRFFAISLFLVELIWPVAGFSEDILNPNKAQQYNFARALYQTGQFDASAAEWLRYMIFFADDSNSGRRYLLSSLYLSQNSQAAELWLADNKKNDPGYDYELAFFRYQKKKFHAAWQLLEAASSNLMKTDKSTLYPEQKFISDFAALRFWSVFYAAGIDLAEKNIPGQVDQKRVRQLLKQLKMAEATTSLWGGAASAFIPGLGQMIHGRTSDGFVSLLAVALTGTLTWLAYRHNEKELFLSMGLLSAALYSANIYGGYLAPYRSAQRQQNHLRTALSELIPLQPAFLMSR